MIRAIVYDAVGTLLHVKPSVAALYVQVGRANGSKLDEAEVRRRFPAAFARQEQIDRELGWRTDEMRERQRWRDIVGEVLDDTNDPLACFETLWHLFSKPDAWTIDPDAARVIQTSQKSGLKQAIASNFDGRLRGLVEHMPELHGLSPIVVSSEVGWRKPAPEFFDHLLQALQMPAHEVLFVGDDRGNDYDAARRLGLPALLLDPLAKHRDVAERIDRLAGLLRGIVQ
jgi:putative hydrolase of the HAD superfamily